MGGNSEPFRLPRLLLLPETFAQACCGSQQTGTQKQHAGGFGNFSNITASKTNLSYVFKDRSVNCRETDACHRLSINGRHREKVLAISVHSEVILKKAIFDVDAFDVNDNLTIDASIYVKHCRREGVIVSQTESQLG